MPVVHRRLLSIVVAALLLLAVETAFADGPMRPFGASGQVAIQDLVGIRTGGIGFLGVLSPASGTFGPVAPPAMSGLVGYEQYETQNFLAGNSTVTVNTISVAPSLDVFVANRVSLGLTAGIAYGWGQYQVPLPHGVMNERGTSFTLGIAPRIGYVFPLGNGFFLWPRVGAGFTHSRADTFDETPGKQGRLTSITAGTRWSGGIDLGVVFRPTRHLFFTATPELAVAHSVPGQMVEGQMVYLGQSTRVRFNGTLGFGVLLGT